MIPSCDQTGVPGFVAFTHFHSSTTSGSASLMSVRIRLKVSPRQPANSLILAFIKRDGDSVFRDVSFFFVMSASVADVITASIRLSSSRHGEQAHDD